MQSESRSQKTNRSLSWSSATSRIDTMVEPTSPFAPPNSGACFEESCTNPAEL